MYEIKSYIILVEFSLFRVDEFVKFEECWEKLPVHTKWLDIITTGKIYIFRRFIHMDIFLVIISLLVFYNY